MARLLPVSNGDYLSLHRPVRASEPTYANRSAMVDPNDARTTPICRCRVLYLGSAVPHITKDGLQGIQEPLRDLYPEQGPFTGKGIDSWLSVWSNGLLLENVDESRRQVTRFFPIDTLHYCAAIRYVVVPGNGGERVDKFLPLDSPFARHVNPHHPPLFACILRRTSGIKVLECHAFVCKKEPAANALVRCCFHAYADSMCVRQLEENPYYLEGRQSRSIPGLDTVEKVEAWRVQTNGGGGMVVTDETADVRGQDTDDENYKVWTGHAPTERELVYVDASGTIRSVKSNAAGSNLGGARSTRPRQMAPPSRPPPPPSPMGSMASRDGKMIKEDPKKEKPKKKGKGKHGDLPPVPPVTNGHAATLAVYPTPQYAAFTSERRTPRAVRPQLTAMEEPIYVSTVRPMSPVASYQPGAFPYEQYYMHYGTAPRIPKPNKKKKEKSSNSDTDSPFNTGIYRKKGHLNERAFSYSIRQEHRSRSTSLANLHFMTNGQDAPASSSGAGPSSGGVKTVSDGVGPSSSVAGPSGVNASSSSSFRQGDKKERELAQLVRDLDLRENGVHHPGPDSNFFRKKAPNYQR